MIENKTVEFKREYLDNIKYTILAFANTDGGTLYIGMEDDGAVVGVENVDDTLLRLSNMVRDTICPDVTLFVDYEVRTMQDGMFAGDASAAVAADAPLWFF